MTTLSPIELRREYRRWSDSFWVNQTALAQIVTEEFPDVDDVSVLPTRYQIDTMRDLALRVGALVEGYERS